jgi:hypothetical protein
MKLAGNIKPICQTVTIKKYGVVKCLTIKEDIPAGTALSVTLNDVWADSAKAADCIYQQLEASTETPIVTAVTIVGTKMSFTGTNLPLDSAGYTSEAVFA